MFNIFSYFNGQKEFGPKFSVSRPVLISRGKRKLSRFHTIFCLFLHQVEILFCSSNIKCFFSLEISTVFCLFHSNIDGDLKIFNTKTCFLRFFDCHMCLLRSKYWLSFVYFLPISTVIWKFSLKPKCSCFFFLFGHPNFAFF